MPSFIENAKEEFAAQNNSHAYEDYLISWSVEQVKYGIKRAIEKMKNEYWYMLNYEDNHYDYRGLHIFDSFDDGWNPLTHGYDNDFNTVLKSYRETGSNPGFGCDEGIDGKYSQYKPKPQDIDFAYINTTMKNKLQELGCKDIYLLIGPEIIKFKKYRTETGFLGKKKNVPYETTATSYRWAVKVTW